MREIQGWNAVFHTFGCSTVRHSAAKRITTRIALFFLPSRYCLFSSLSPFRCVALLKRPENRDACSRSQEGHRLLKRHQLRLFHRQNNVPRRATPPDWIAVAHPPPPSFTPPFSRLPRSQCRLSRSQLLLEWDASPVNDMLADSLVALAAQAQTRYFPFCFVFRGLTGPALFPLLPSR